MGIPPLFFNQLTSTIYTEGSDCGDVWCQHMWQSADKVGREDVADAIREAEDRLKGVVGYNLLPDWTIDERIETTRPARPELFAGTSGNIRGQLKSVQTRWAYVISGGQKQKDVIEADVAVTDAAGALSDLDGDTYDETVTITVNVAAFSGIIADEIKVYYADAEDEVQFPAMDEWEIRPISVTILAGVATIVFKRWQIVSPQLQMRLTCASIDGDVDASYADVVDVYRVWNDPQSMANLLWESNNEPTGCVSCGGAGCVSCSFNAQVGCFHVRNDRLGIIAYTPATWDAANSQFNSADYLVGRDPDKIRAWYYSGYQSDNPSVATPRSKLDPFWEKVIAHFASGLLDRPICSCNNVERFVDYWREDLARTGRDVAFQSSPSDIDNPFGTNRGAIEAWRKVNAPNSDWIVKR